MKNIKEKYQKEAIPALKEKFGYKNNLAVPRIVKVVINTGFNPANRNEKAQEEIAADLSVIIGQKTVSCQSKVSESGFKIRKGMVIGLKATLRGQKMYDFLDRLVNIALPRCRDFRGLPEKNIDREGSLNIGIKEQIVFSEISAENAKNIFGFQVSVTTTAKTKKEGLELFKLLGFPIKIDKKQE